VALTSLLTLGALATLAAPYSGDYVALAALLALVVGLARILLGITRLGWVAYLMSLPVVTGFMAAAALLILSSQLPTALGVQPPEGSLLARAWWSLTHVLQWEPASAVLAGVTVALVLWGSRVHALFPGVLAAVAIGLGFSMITGYDGSTVGDVPTGLPPFSLALPWGSLPQLLVPGVVIALVGFAEAAAISRTFAVQDRQRWSPNREFVSQGMANLAAAVSGAFPVGGSFSRSSINRLAGGKTRWSGAITGLVVLAFLPVAGILAPLPRAILGAIVIAAVVKVIAPRALLGIARFSRPQAAVAWLTFVLTLALAPRIERAVLVGIGFAVLVHIWRELRVHVRAHYEAGTVTLEPEGVLFFASAPALGQALIEELAAHPDAERVILDLKRLGRIDFTGVRALQSVAEEAERAGLSVRLTDIPTHSRELITRVLGRDSPLLDAAAVPPPGAPRVS
jgi:SulP family sulfate permease